MYSQRFEFSGEARFIQGIEKERISLLQCYPVVIEVLLDCDILFMTSNFIYLLIPCYTDDTLKYKNGILSEIVRLYVGVEFK